MSRAQEVLSTMQQRRLDNLSFFKKFQPQIFEAFSSYELQKSKLNISPDGQKVNLVVDGAPLYSNDYRETGRQECDIFTKAFPRNSPNLYYSPPHRSIYGKARFFHKLVNEFAKGSPSDIAPGNRLMSRSHFPLVVVTGVGLGGHIEALCNTEQVNHLIIIEPDPDIFAASLYTLDWRGLFNTRMQDEHLSIDISIGNILEEESKFAAVWNKLVKMNPLFPTSTYFLNHLGKAENVQLIDRFNKDITAYYSVWGFYDDELNQLNQCLHNLNRNSEVLLSKKPEAPETPVFIIGAGPSLDTRIEDIVKYKDQAIIISCGTALKSLHHYGIKPDFHVELESHFVVINALTAINDPEYLKSITLISPAHVHPGVIEQFGKSLVYFKRESSLWGMFGDNSAVVPFGTPTCTNAALAFCYYFGFSQLYLFGCDYGYKDLNNHHAAGSIYYEDSFKDRAMTSEKNLKRLKGVHGDTILCTDLLFTSMRTVEKVAYVIKQRGNKIYNCSEGAELLHTSYLSQAELNSNLIAADKNSCIKSLNNLALHISQETITKGIENTAGKLNQLFNDIDQRAFKDNIGFEQIAYLVNLELEQKFLKEEPALYWSIRGSIWHLCYVYYTHQLTSTDSKSEAIFTNKFRKALEILNNQIQKDYKSFLNKKFDNDDPWLKVPIEVLPEGENIEINWD